MWNFRKDEFAIIEKRRKMNNPNGDIGNSAEDLNTADDKTGWKSVEAKADKMGKVIYAGEVTKVIERDGDIDYISKYDLDWQDDVEGPYGRGIAELITSDAVGLDLDKGVLKQLSEKGGVNPAELSEFGRKFYDDFVWHMERLASKEYREQARLVLDQIKDVGLVGNFMSRVFDSAVEINDHPELLQKEKEKRRVQKERFDELERRYAEVTNPENGGIDDEKLKHLLSDYNTFLEEVTNGDMVSVIKERKQKVVGLLNKFESIMREIDDL